MYCPELEKIMEGRFDLDNVPLPTLDWKNILEGRFFLKVDLTWVIYPTPRIGNFLWKVDFF